MQISDAEWTVMNVVWDREPIEAADVIAAVAESNDWSPATVKTMLHRLVRKGALEAKSQGKKYIYRPAIRREDCVRQESRSFLDRVFGGQVAPALIHLVEAARLSPKEAAEIRALLDQKLSETDKDGAES